MDFCFQKSEELSLQKAISLEWLETNGLGGYASSTILNCNTRKYHGLLVCPVPDLPDKYVLLSQLEDTFLKKSEEYPLSVFQYDSTIQEEGFSHYQELTLDTHPCITYQFDKITLTKEILMLDQENTLLIKYTISNSGMSKIAINPLIALRNFHGLSKENGFIQSQIEDCLDGRKLTSYDNMPSLFFQTDANFSFLSQPVWYKNFDYEQEKQRGFDYLEDLFSPGTFTLSFPKNKEIIFSCGTQEQDEDLATKWKKEIQRRKNLLKKTKGTSLQKQLKTTSLSFIQKKPHLDTLSIIAGYHWFPEWGRDTMISLPGLMLYSGLEEEYLTILQEFCKHEYQGLLSNIPGDIPEKNNYNSVDTSLWFAWAVQQYYLKTKDFKTVIKHFWLTLNNIFSHYKAGTLFNIKMLENGLLSAGTKETNLTWMDVMIDSTPVTPRNGCAVEINALWFNMLSFMHTLAKKLSDPIEAELKSLIQSITTSFRETFWDDDLGYLKDLVNDEIQDSSIRPNQIFAVSLPYSPLTKSMSTQVVETVRKHLLTPYGLRTLSPEDPNYKGHYSLEKDFMMREKAYHNGTVWPWLLGHFGEALIKVTRNKKEAIKTLNASLKNIQLHLADAGIGTISEIFDGDEPHHPCGCISQAWSVGEILRLTHIIGSQ